MMNAEQKRRAERILSEWHDGKYSAARHGVEMASLLHELVDAPEEFESLTRNEDGTVSLKPGFKAVAYTAQEVLPATNPAQISSSDESVVRPGCEGAPANPNNPRAVCGKKAPEPGPVACDLHMDAYHYSFSQTGVFAIDRILSAVACAGKAFHHTSQWQDECAPYAGHVGVTPIDWIQNAANDAAKTYNVASVSDINTLQSILALDEAVTGAVMKAQVLKLLRMQVSNEVNGTDTDNLGVELAGPAPSVLDGHVCVQVSGLTGSGKSAVAGEIEIALRTIGLDVEWADSESEKRLTHADYVSALELYKPKVRIFEKNIPRATPTPPEPSTDLPTWENGDDPLVSGGLINRGVVDFVALGVWSDKFASNAMRAGPTPAEPPADVARDAARLNWLDKQNTPHGLGWEVIQMPAGNVNIHTVVGEKVEAEFKSIREAIDAARERQGGE